MIGPFAAALFDLDDTLHDDGTTYRTAALRAAGEVAHAHGVAPEALVDAYVAELERFWLRLSAGDLRVSIRRERVRMWATALERVRIAADRAVLAERLASAYVTHRDGLLQPFPGALDLLVRLRAAGRKTGLVTNGFAETHRDKVALLGFGDAFDTIVFADQAGYIKPDPRIFLHACEQIAVAPRDGVMIGDRYERGRPRRRRGRPRHRVAEPGGRTGAAGRPAPRRDRVVVRRGRQGPRLRARRGGCNALRRDAVLRE